MARVANSIHTTYLLYFVFLVLFCVQAQSPTDGFVQYQDDFYVQNRTNASMAERYWFRDSIHSCQLYRGEERVEMRWDTWTDQRTEHLFEVDMMYENGTSHTCVSQIKSNESGEVNYLQVFNGNLHIGSQGTTPILRNYWDKWFNLKTAFNPSTGRARIWINDELISNRTTHRNTRGWYFKNGTYGTNNHSKSNYRNIKHWIRGQTPVQIITSSPQKNVANSTYRTFITQSNNLILPQGYTGMATSVSVFDLTGRLVRNMVISADALHCNGETSTSTAEGCYIVQIKPAFSQGE